ncbi:phosphonate C-P lyase system protein PhnH [Synechococcus sp. H70.2]|uniref:phosphonate C-P lyase system protein PhnH n=1 Tax=unclassified Synechococcus TaxID=2626047 RepID=UPI0039C2067E
MSVPIPAAERQSQQVFRTLVMALSYPGRLWRLPTHSLRQAFRLIGTTLVDGNVGVWAPDWLLLDLRGQAPRPVALEAADFVFAERLADLPAGWETLSVLKRGTYLEPESGATLILGTGWGQGSPLVFKGPGIAGEVRLAVDLPPAFWRLRSQISAYPLGVDILLTDGQHVVGIPRSVEVG